VAVTLTYDATLSRVQVNATGLAAADYATVEISTDQINWTVVRGGSDVGVTAGAFDLPVDVYEFSPDVINYFRVRGVETGLIEFVAAGSGTSGNNSSLVPGMPAGLTVGDLLIIYASIRNSGTGTVNVPAGWTLMRQYGNTSFLGRRYVSGDTAPTVTFTGGVANADTMARMGAFRRAELNPVTGVDQLNASAQNIDSPALTIPDDDLAVIEATWKQDDYSSNSARSGYTSIGGVTATAGDDAAMSWWYRIQTTAADLAIHTHTVVGGAAAISRATIFVLEHAAYLNEQTANITPTLDAVWLKSIARPFLNQTVEIVQPAGMGVTRPARTGVFDIVGRSFPVAVNDVRKSRRWTMHLRTEDDAAKGALELLLASGDVILIQVPASCDHIPHGYVTVGDYDETWHPLRPRHVLHALPVIEVAPPGAGVIGASVTWTTVINNYPDWLSLLQDQASWASTLTLVGDPGEVIVG
jgi:hypothetical protein